MNLARRAIIEALISVIVFLLSIEGILRLFDPWGTATYYRDTYRLEQLLAPDETLHYVLPAGTYSFTHWSATERSDHTRRAPNDREGSCIILFIGDSVTWGQSVNDAETWVNQLAAPDVHLVNAAMIGYNSDVIRRLPALWPAVDVVFYLVIPNDLYRSNTLAELKAQPDPAQFNYLRLYLENYRQATQAIDPDQNGGDWTRFYADLDALSADPRMTFVAFDDAFGRLIDGRYSVHLIPWYTSHVSYTDAHPDTAGNREIASAMLPIIRQAVSTHCTALL